MKRGRGRPSKYLSNTPQSHHHGAHKTNQHGGQESRSARSPHAIKTRVSGRSTPRKYYFGHSSDSESDNESTKCNESSGNYYLGSKTLRIVIEPMKRQQPPLNLPPSSDDLLLPTEFVLQALGIYEVLRHFSRIMRLSLFRFEDFCAAIMKQEQSTLLTQIHMALVRVLLSEDEANGLMFSASDEKDSVNIFLHCFDTFTWPEVIRSYVCSKVEANAAAKAVDDDGRNPFPFTPAKERLAVLQQLCDQFLSSNTVRDDILNEGLAESEDHCRHCGKMGDLLCCETCPAVYHLHCLKPALETVPEGDWSCPVCEAHRLKGVTDCSSDWKKDGWLRNTPIGEDREGRKYWFLARRLIVEGEKETYFYSCKAHLDELLACLEEDQHETSLLLSLKDMYNTMMRQMKVTEVLVEASKGNMATPWTLRQKVPVRPERKQESFTVMTNGTADRPENLASSTKLSSTTAMLTFVPDDAVMKMVLGHPVVTNSDVEGPTNPAPSLHRKEGMVESQEIDTENSPGVKENLPSKCQTNSDDAFSKAVRDSCSEATGNLSKGTVELPCKDSVELSGKETVESMSEGNAGLLSKEAVQLPIKGAVQLPIKGGVQLSVKGGLQLPIKGGVQLPITEAVQLPIEGGVQLPIKEAVQLAIKGGVQLPIKGGVQLPVKAGVQLPIKEAVQLPIKGGVQLPVKAGVQLPIKEAVQLPSIGGVQLPIKGAVQLPIKGGVQLPIKGGVQLPIKEAVQLPSIGGVQLPIKEAVQLPIKEAVQLPSIGGVQLPIKEAVQLPIKEAVQLPSIGGVQLPIKEAVQLPSIGGVQLPIKEAVQLPSIGGVQLPIKEAVQLPSKRGVQVPIKEAAQLPSKRGVQVPRTGVVSLPNIETMKLPNKESVKPPISQAMGSTSVWKTLPIPGVISSVPSGFKQTSSGIPVNAPHTSKPVDPTKDRTVSGKQTVIAGLSSATQKIKTLASGGMVVNLVKNEGTPDKESKNEKQLGTFRLGMEGHYTTYMNQYSTNNLALNKYQHMEQRDRRRLVVKFNLNEFKWLGELYGNKDAILNSLRCSMVAFEGTIPTAFVHPVWPLQRSTWVRAVHSSKTPCEFAAALTFVQRLIKPICFLSVWNDAVGHMKFCRIPSENRSVSKKKEHKEEEEEEEETRDIVNYSWVPNHQVWKQKGEEYRIFAGGGWVWTSGLQLRKRNRADGDTKDNFPTKKRKLGEVVDTIYVRKEAKKKKKKEAEEDAKKLMAKAVATTLATTGSVSLTPTAGLPLGSSLMSTSSVCVKVPTLTSNTTLISAPGVSSTASGIASSLATQVASQPNSSASFLPLSTQTGTNSPVTMVTMPTAGSTLLPASGVLSINGVGSLTASSVASQPISSSSFVTLSSQMGTNSPVTMVPMTTAGSTLLSARGVSSIPSSVGLLRTTSAASRPIISASLVTLSSQAGTNSPMLSTLTAGSTLLTAPAVGSLTATSVAPRPIDSASQANTNSPTTMISTPAVDPTLPTTSWLTSLTSGFGSISPRPVSLQASMNNPPTTVSTLASSSTSLHGVHSVAAASVSGCESSNTVVSQANPNSHVTTISTLTSIRGVPPLAALPLSTGEPSSSAICLQHGPIASSISGASEPVVVSTDTLSVTHPTASQITSDVPKPGLAFSSSSLRPTLSTGSERLSPSAMLTPLLTSNGDSPSQPVSTTTLCSVTTPAPGLSTHLCQVTEPNCFVAPLLVTTVSNSTHDTSVSPMHLSSTAFATSTSTFQHREMPHDSVNSDPTISPADALGQGVGSISDNFEAKEPNPTSEQRDALHACSELVSKEVSALGESSLTADFVEKNTASSSNKVGEYSLVSDTCEDKQPSLTLFNSSDFSSAVVEAGACDSSFGLSTYKPDDVEMSSIGAFSSQPCPVRDDEVVAQTSFSGGESGTDMRDVLKQRIYCQEPQHNLDSNDKATGSQSTFHDSCISAMEVIEDITEMEEDFIMETFAQYKDESMGDPQTTEGGNTRLSQGESVAMRVNYDYSGASQLHLANTEPDTGMGPCILGSSSAIEQSSGCLDNINSINSSDVVMAETTAVKECARIAGASNVNTVETLSENEPFQEPKESSDTSVMATKEFPSIKKPEESTLEGLLANIIAGSSDVDLKWSSDMQTEAAFISGNSVVLEPQPSFVDVAGICDLNDPQMSQGTSGRLLQESNCSSVVALNDTSSLEEPPKSDMTSSVSRTDTIVVELEPNELGGQSHLSVTDIPIIKEEPRVLCPSNMIMADCPIVNEDPKELGGMLNVFVTDTGGPSDVLLADTPIREEERVELSPPNVTITATPIVKEGPKELEGPSDLLVEDTPIRKKEPEELSPPNVTMTDTSIMKEGPKELEGPSDLLVADTPIVTKEHEELSPPNVTMTDTSIMKEGPKELEGPSDLLVADTPIRKEEHEELSPPNVTMTDTSIMNEGPKELEGPSDLLVADTPIVTKEHEELSPPNVTMIDTSIMNEGPKELEGPSDLLVADTPIVTKEHEELSPPNVTMTDTSIMNEGPKELEDPSDLLVADTPIITEEHEELNPPNMTMTDTSIMNVGPKELEGPSDLLVADTHIVTEEQEELSPPNVTMTDTSIMKEGPKELEGPSDLLVADTPIITEEHEELSAPNVTITDTSIMKEGPKELEGPSDLLVADTPIRKEEHEELSPPNVTITDTSIMKEGPKELEGPPDLLVADTPIRKEEPEELSPPNVTMTDTSIVKGGPSNVPVADICGADVTMTDKHVGIADTSSVTVNESNRNTHPVLTESLSAMPVSPMIQGSQVPFPTNSAVPSPSPAVVTTIVSSQVQAVKQVTPATGPGMVTGKSILSCPVSSAVTALSANPAVKPQVLQPQLPAVKTVPVYTRPILPSGQMAVPFLYKSEIQSNTQAPSQPSVTPVSGTSGLVANIATQNILPCQPPMIRLVAPTGASVTLQAVQQALASLQQQSLLKPGNATITLNFAQSPLVVPAQGTNNSVVTPVRTVASSTNNTCVGAARPQQVAAVKATRPTEPSRLPSQANPTFPIVRDPRKLLEQVISRWPKRHRVKSIFSLDKRTVRVLGRKAGMKEVKGFLYSTRGVGSNWPMSLPRPNFRVAWNYRTRSLKTFGGVAMQIRILHSCMKWGEINVRPPKANRTTMCTSFGTTTTEILDRRFVAEDGLRAEYLVRKTIRSHKKPAEQSPKAAPTVSKRGRTLRPKAVPQPEEEDLSSGPKVFETWFPEAKLELWEVRQYNEYVEREKALQREKRLQAEAMQRAVAMRAAALERKQEQQQQQHILKMNKKKVQNAIKTQQKKPPVFQAIRPLSHIKPNCYLPLLPSRRAPPRFKPQIPAHVGVVRPQLGPDANYKAFKGVTPVVQRRPPVVPVVAEIPPRPSFVGSSGAAPKMKHTEEQSLQANRLKGKRNAVAVSSRWRARVMARVESMHDINRMTICQKVMENMLDRIDRAEDAERKKEQKAKARVLRLERARLNKLEALLYKRKEILRKDMARKRSLLEKEVSLKIQSSIANKRKLEKLDETAKTKRRKVDEHKLICVCKSPYDETRFYVCCDLCANWFHGDCVDVRPEEASTKDWTCTDCNQAKKGVEEEELYCICREPYDESKFYVGCDKCQDWFHGSCVGVSQAEADQLNTYFCPRCRGSESQLEKKSLSTRDADSLKRLLRSLQSHKMAWPFLEPVSFLEVPEYYEIIKNPMDLSTVEGRLSSSAYNTLETFVTDISQIFNNCRLFNPRDSPYYRCAEVLENFFVQKLRAWKRKR